MEVIMSDQNDMRTRFNEMSANPARRALICLCIDSSYSMTTNHRIDAINEEVTKFIGQLYESPYAKDAAEICIVSFGNTVQVECPFDSVGNTINKSLFHPIRAVGSATRLGEGVLKALDEIDKRQKMLTGHSMYTPWLIIMSDGDATDDISVAAKEVQTRLKKSHGLKVKCINMGSGSKSLEKFTADGKVQRLEDMEVETFFSMLSRSISEGSRQAIYDADLDLD